MSGGVVRSSALDLEIQKRRTEIRAAISEASDRLGHRDFAICLTDDGIVWVTLDQLAREFGRGEESAEELAAANARRTRMLDEARKTVQSGGTVVFSLRSKGGRFRFDVDGDLTTFH